MFDTNKIPSPSLKLSNECCDKCNAEHSFVKVEMAEFGSNVNLCESCVRELVSDKKEVQ